MDYFINEVKKEANRINRRNKKRLSKYNKRKVNEKEGEKMKGVKRITNEEIKEYCKNCSMYCPICKKCSGNYEPGLHSRIAGNYYYSPVLYCAVGYGDVDFLGSKCHSIEDIEDWFNRKNKVKSKIEIEEDKEGEYLLEFEDMEYPELDSNGEVWV